MAPRAIIAAPTRPAAGLIAFESVDYDLRPEREWNVRTDVYFLLAP